MRKLPGEKMIIEKTMTPPKLVPQINPVQDSINELTSMLTKPQAHLADFFSLMAFDGGVDHLTHPVSALPVFRTHRTSGFNYAIEAKMLAYVRFGVTTSRFLVVQALILDGASAWTSHYYSQDGAYAFSEGPITHSFEEHTEILMESECPFLNHLYNIVAAEYAKTSEGKANTRLIHTIERTFRKLQKTRGNELSVSKGIHDPAVEALSTRLMGIELDPVYTWKERRTLFSVAKGERANIIHTKKRVHKKSFFSYLLPLMACDSKSALQRFAKRPYSNIFGIVETLCLDPIRWFISVVRGNMGYSVALAIYSPFTFFFITQPMNPHAMWAVGKVRNAYIATSDTLKNTFETPTGGKISTTAVLTTGAVAGTVASGTVALANQNSGKNYSEMKPAFGNFLLSSDAPDVNTQTWDDRMSNFKAMQISYEENMEVAPRIGRLEQMETQLNWPLIIESTWMQTERYLDFLSFVEFNAKDYKPEFIAFVRAEKARTDQVQLYLWDRNVRFILDHPFTMMDQSGEQTQMDYYVGRSFIMLRDMTNNLAIKHKGLPMPAGYDSVMKLAQKFDGEYKAGGSVLDRLKNNSKLFAQKDATSTAELRSYMKRQWEILYLLQNHAQEASNFGLQVYIWSVRNAVYVLQSLYANKRDDVSLLAMNFRKDSVANKLSNNANFKHMDSQYEALYHMMMLEYTSVRKEMGESLKRDIESVQRKEIIGGVESFLKERDALLQSGNLI